MQCSKETLVWLFYNLSTSFQLLFFFVYLTSIVLPKLFSFIGGNPFQRNEDEYEYEYGAFSEEEENGYYQVDSMEKDHLVADVIHGGESLSFLHTKSTQNDQLHAQEMADQPIHEDPNESSGSDRLSFYTSPISGSEYGGEEDILNRDTESAYNSDTNDKESPSTRIDKSGFVMRDDENHDGKYRFEEVKRHRMEGNFSRDDKFFIYAPPKLESKRVVEVEEKDDVEIFGDSCTVGSTSKSSSEWRSSINYRESGTEDPFSSSSRRSCPKWESYTLFQKYDEEMLFLDRISAQKLHETESLRSIQHCPRSISERIVHKLSTINKKSSDIRHNPYHELEAAYVAQICLTWEALNWNYKYFHRLRASRGESDPGCPAYIAQQFQQFQVLLQRYVENEPYEHGRRPEVYARMRGLAPKLLQVPEYRDSDDEKREEGAFSRISSDSFLLTMEESIRIFMNFLKADRENHCQILTAFFRRNRRGAIDPTHLLLLKKINKKKKLKLKDLRRSRKCLRKRRLKEEEEMEILMAQIDLKVVSRVLRTTDLSEEQVHWCEDKMAKVRVCDGKLRRDSSPLFFPAH